MMVPHAVEPKNVAEIVFVSGPAHWKSIVWFIEEVWPRFVGTGMMLHVYGSVCKNLKKYARVEGVLLHGTVASLDAIYRRGDIVINPVQFGGGLKIKSVEALAYGLPLVATSEAVNGMEDAEGKAYLLANTQEEWVEALAMLFFSEHLRHILACNGLCFARKHFVSSVCYGELGELLCGEEAVVQQISDFAYRLVETKGLLASLRARLPELLLRLYTLQAQGVLRTDDDARSQHIEYIAEWSFALFQRYQASGWRGHIQALKKVPLLGRSLLYFKRKLLKWDI